MSRALIHNWSGGIVNDPRDTSVGVSRVVTNFDINTSPNRLIPYVSSEDGNSNASNDLMQNWCVALRTGTTYALYGYGRATATNYVRIFFKNLTTGASTDLDDNGWTETGNNLSAGQVTPAYGCFIYYKKTGFIYGGHGGRYIWKYDPSGSVAFAETHEDLTAFSSIVQGIVHSQDDVLYIPYDNKIAKNDNGSWTVAALTLPAQYVITSICEFKSYIAILAAPLSGVGNSRLYIWDRSTTLSTITENIDAGSGIGLVLEEIDGYLVWISTESSFSGGTRYKEKINFRYYTGAGAQLFKQFVNTTNSNTLLSVKQKRNNRVYFMLTTTLNGATREGVWSFGRNSSGQFNLVHERTPNNDTAIGNGALRGFFYVGDYLFQAFAINAGTHTVSKTDDQVTYSATSKFESQINPGMVEGDKILLKKLTGVRLTYNTLSAVSGNVVLKYKADGASSYTTIFTATTTGLNTIEKASANGAQFKQGREYEFQIFSTLGADIINAEYDYEVIIT